MNSTMMGISSEDAILGQSYDSNEFGGSRVAELLRMYGKKMK